jgi:hypothetical protein
MLWLKKIFSDFFASNYIFLGRKQFHNIGYQDKRQFQAENWQNTPKIVITALTLQVPRDADEERAHLQPSRRILRSEEPLGLQRLSRPTPEGDLQPGIDFTKRHLDRKL